LRDLEVMSNKFNVNRFSRSSYQANDDGDDDDDDDDDDDYRCV
jgi:hypothetical protein